MAQSTQVQREGVAQVAGRILLAWYSGESTGLTQELEHARSLAEAPHSGALEIANTFEMERLEALSGAVESLGHSHGRHLGAVRLLEHLAQAAAPGETQPAHRQINE